jgi:type II secretory pathway component GspD/PulD (secretin)
MRRILMIGLIIGILTMSISNSALADQKAALITEVKVRTFVDKVVVSVISIGPITYEVQQLKKPSRLLVDVRGILGASPLSLPTDLNWIDRVTVNQLSVQPNIARIEFRTSGWTNYEIEPSPDREILKISVFKPPSQEAVQAEIPEEKREMEEMAAAPSVTEVEEQPKELPIIEGEGGSKIIPFLDFREIDIKDVLRTLARLSRVNIIPDQTVVGLVTITLNNMEFEEALKLILKTHGYGYRKIGDTYIVSLPDRLERKYDKPVTEAITLNYASPTDVQVVIGQIFGENVLSAAYTIGAGAGTSTVRDSNIIVISGRESDIAEAKDLIMKLDKPEPQVLIEVKVEEVSSEATRELGIEWQVVSGKFAFAINPVTEIVDAATGLISKVINRSIAVFDPTQNLIPSLGVALRAMEITGDAKQLNHSVIAATNNQEARVLSGERIKVSIAGQVVAEEAGVKLAVTPRVHPDGYITLILHPEVSTIKQLEVGLSQVSTREAETSIMVKNGDTVVIGGLQATEIFKDVTKVPFLGDLPILGQLFRDSKDRKKELELLILVTPHILPSR